MAKAKKGKLIIEDALVPVEEQPYEIPRNWCWIHWGNAGEFIAGNGFKNNYQGFTEYDIPFYKVGSLKYSDENGYLYDDANTINEKMRSELKATLIPVNSVLFAKIGEAIRLNRRSLNSVPCCIDNNMMAFIADKCLYKYVYYWSKGIELYDYANATTVPAVRKSDLENIPFPLPPLAEQKRIVEQIENLFSKLDEAKEKVSDALDEFENRKGAIMHAAFSGKLTQEWRKKNKISDDSWKHVAMGDIAKFHQGVQVPVDEQYDENSEDRVRFIRIVDYTQGNEAPRYVSKDKATDDTHVMGNEIVMVRYGASAGFVGDNIEGVIANNMFTITVDEEIREYIKLYLRSPHMYKLLNTSGGSSAMPALNFKVVSKIELDIPSYDEIEQIYKVLNPVIEKYDKTEAIYINVIEQIELIKKAILAKAFRGELGTNIPEDENALLLLESIIDG